MSDTDDPPTQTLALVPSQLSAEQILRLETLLLTAEAAGCPTAAIRMRNFFSPGLYAREMFIPAGTLLTGAVHKTVHLVVFDGDMTVWCAGATARLIGHQTMTSEAGAKRVGYAHVDSYVTSYFPNPDDETDVRKLEARFVVEHDRLQCNRTSLSFEEIPQMEIES